MLSFIGNRPFLLHHAQGFPQYVLINAYEDEERELRKDVRSLPISEVPNYATVIYSHII